MSYASEQAFSRAFLQAVRARYPLSLVQRIETGTTGRGVPDIYVRFRGREMWIELKNERSMRGGRDITVRWRPGQKGWMKTWHRITDLCCYTIVALREGFAFIRMNRPFKNNTVLWHEYEYFESLSKLTEALHDY